MNKKILTKISSSLLVLLMVAVLLVGTVTPSVAGAKYEADYIKKLDNVINNYEQYLDSAAVFKLPDTVKDTDELSLIIMLEGDSVLDAYSRGAKEDTLAQFSLGSEAQAIKDKIKKEKRDFLEALDRENISYATGADYSTVLCGFELVIKAADFESTSALLGSNATAVVGEVYKVAETKLVNNDVNFYEDTGIFDSSDFAYDGEGMVVAVLDTGLDYTHSAFSPDNFTSKKLGLTKEEVAAIIGDTRAYGLFAGLTADDVYINDKVPFSFDYADYDSDVYSMHNNHGTHVSGVIAGKDDVITGVAPNAQIVSMKTFSDIEDSARSSWILNALEDCVILGVDVINMSLGTACGFSREVDKEIISGVYDKIREAGIGLVVAASNSYSSTYGSEKNGNLGLTSNPDSGTVGSPSTYDGALSVASIAGEKTPYILYDGKIVYFVEATNSATKEKDFVTELLGKIGEGKDTLEVEYILIPGLGRPADYTGLDMTGKIALVSRGSTTFEEKANAALSAGAAGIIIYNNVAGDIRMNAGITEIPICSIGQDDGEMLAKAGSGKITVSVSQTSGPFISDFSSWGPTPDLGIKPEITAHGGNILSAVTGGDYDRLSGTSMACPNMSGVVALMRQYVKDAFPEIADDNVEVNALVYRLLMSTADITLNRNGLPYAVRKQGAGLANLTSAAATSAYIMTYDREDGSLMDKTKIELGDDPSRRGEYTLKFSVNNFGYYDLTYNLAYYVMTEGVSETKTHKDDTTVSEEGYILGDATVSVKSISGGSVDGNKITVPAGSITDLVVTIKLGDADKKYLDESFENGMYVEGFIKLDAVSGTDVSLSVPYLAFYGDWTEAPLFDIDYFETHADELDDSIQLLDKILPDAYATRPIGGISLDYVSYLGSYYFIQDPNNKIISASRDYIALSNYDGTIHSLRFVWAGMLRNAQRIVITITDDATGEVIFERVEEDVRKSYGDGGSIYPANVEIEFDTADYNLKNNTQYTVRLEGYLDYGDGGFETNKNNVFEFPFTTDFEAPAITDCEFYTEYDKSTEKTRLFAKMAVYDNRYAMALQVGYVGDYYDAATGENSYMFNAFGSYTTPVYSVCDGITYVEYELTDYIYEIKENSINKNCFTVTCYDYALNEATYEIPLPDDFRDFYFEEEEIVLSPNEVYTLKPLVYPGTEWGELLQYSCANTSVLRVVNNKVVAVGPGVATLVVKSPTSNDRKTVKVTVVDEDDPRYVWYEKPVADVFTLDGFYTNKAYFILANDERDIGVDGDITKFSGSDYSLSLYPSESVTLMYTLSSFFSEDTEVVFESSNESVVSVLPDGTVTANAEGYASVALHVLLDGESTYYSESVMVDVKDPYVRTGPSLTHYYGSGGLVEIPESLLLTEIGNYAFSNFDYVAKDENDEISEDEPDLTKMQYLGDATIKTVIIPEGVKKIGAYAFANLTALEKVVLPTTLEAIEYGAFYGCVKLTEVEGIEHVKLINKEAFFGCNLTDTLSLDSAHAISDYAFAGNEYLKEVILPETLRSIGAYAFYKDKRIEKVTINAVKVKYGAYVFADCSAITELSINSAVIPTGAFSGCSSLEQLNIGIDVAQIGELAFKGTAIKKFTLDSKNVYYRVSEGGDYLVSWDSTELLHVAPTVKGKFTLSDSRITKVANGAFSSTTYVTSVDMPHVTYLDNNAFYGCTRLSSFNLGELTHIGDYAFYSTAMTQTPSFDSVSRIGKYAFAFTKLTSVKINDGITVGEGAFFECKELSSVDIGDGVTLEYGAFMLDRNSSLPDPDLDGVPYYLDENGKRVYYYYFKSELVSLTIGNGVNIGEAAFFGASELSSVTLGEGAVIGARAFYNASKLSEIDLSKVVSIGEMAFSGDVYYVFSDSSYNNVVVKDGYYVYRYYAPIIKKAELLSLKELGNAAFQYARELESVTLSEGLGSVANQAFANCEKLNSVKLGGVNVLCENAFAETAIESIDLSGVSEIGKYAFVYCDQLTDLTLSRGYVDIGEGAFAYCSKLSEPQGIKFADRIGAYAFAYTDITRVDLTGASYIGDYAFMKDELTEFKVSLGNMLTSLGDNPFAMCIIEPFSTLEKKEFNGIAYTDVLFTYDISTEVKVIDGSLYCKVPSGLELITYAGGDAVEAAVAEGTVRITGLAFAGAEVVRVDLPLTLKSIGHKAFFACDKLQTVIFKTYEAPNLEEEFDQAYHDSYENIPATGDFEFILYDGTEVVHKGIEILPYYMWNATSTQYSNVYYGANFINYIGKGDKELVMIRPVNGLYYETFIYSQYFKTIIDGAAAPDEITLRAIAAIDLIPEGVTLEDEALVIAARAAYDLIATDAQKVLVTNASVLFAAERRIEALKSANGPEDENTDADTAPDGENDEDNAGPYLTLITVFGAVILLGAFFTVRAILDVRKKRKDAKREDESKDGEEKIGDAEQVITEEDSEPDAATECAPEDKEQAEPNDEDGSEVIISDFEEISESEEKEAKEGEENK